MPAGEGGEVFDYVIAGAGTAGCVLANRLSADPGKRVCLIEAGPPDNSYKIRWPAAVAAAIGDKRFGWGYFTTPQEGAGGRPVFIPRGRVIGGSSSINGMVYFRGHPRDFDDWSGRFGARGWSYGEVLPYFRRSENNEAWTGSPYHGVGGEMNVKDIPRNNPLIELFLQGIDSLQFKRNPDFNAADPEGFGPRQATIKGGRRVSMASAFLDPVRQRPNLKVLSDATVTRVLVEGGRAAGVEIDAGGGRRTIACRGEVVLCGGAYGSPHMLLLSGIGDGEELKAAGVEPVHHLPMVGRNLGDHPAAAVAKRTRDPRSYGLSARALPRDLWNIAEYALMRRGPIASNLLEGTGFVKSTPGLERPDLQLVLIPAHRNASGFPIPFGHGFGVISINVRPKSRGAVRLAGPDPRTAPAIDPRLLSEPEDIEVILRGLRLGRRIMASPSLASLNAWEIIPGEDVQSDEALAEHVRRTLVTVHHPSGSCAMGSDPSSVCDPELRVRGIAGLRVADASVFPDMIAGNSNAAVVMVAEKAADLILGRPAPPAEQVPH
jgi:choline dehydrogenase-like flavoprotein